MVIYKGGHENFIFLIRKLQNRKSANVLGVQDR